MTKDKQKRPLSGDGTQVFGQVNDQRLAAKVEKLTGPSIDAVISRLEDFAKSKTSVASADPFPFGFDVPEEAPKSEAAVTHGVRNDDMPQPAVAEDVAAADTLDDMLDSIEGDYAATDQKTEDDDVTEQDTLEAAEEVQVDDYLEDGDYPQSPIGAVLIAPVPGGIDAEDNGYFDPGLPQESSASDLYDPMDLLDQVLPEDDIEAPPYFEGNEGFDEFDDGEDDAGDAGVSEAESGYSYGLPEPSPMGNIDGMGGFGYFGGEETPTDAENQITEEPSDTAFYGGTDMENRSDKDILPDEERDSGTGDVMNEIDTLFPDEDDDDGELTGQKPEDVSDDLFDDLMGGADEQEVSSSDAPAEEMPNHGEDDFDTRDEIMDDSAESAKKGGKLKAILMGTAAAAILAAVGFGAYQMLSKNGDVPPQQVAQTEEPFQVGAGSFDPAPPAEPISVTSLEGIGSFDDTSAGDDDLSDLASLLDNASLDEPVSDGQEDAPAIPEEIAAIEPADPFNQAVLAPLGDENTGFSEPEGEGVDVTPSVQDPDLAALLGEIDSLDRVNVAPDLSPAISALEQQIAKLQDDLKSRDAMILDVRSELTGFSDQIASLVQRDADQAERIDRMERLVRSQNAILAQFGRLEESLEQTQIVLLDISSRTGRLEGQNPADRDAVNRALTDMNEKIQSLTANMSIIARMQIEGVDSLRTGSPSSAGQFGVQTSQAPAPRAGNDTVYQGQPGGFNVVSDPNNRVPANVKKDDFVEGYGYVLDVLPASNNQKLVVMENGSVLIPN